MQVGVQLLLLCLLKFNLTQQNNKLVVVTVTEQTFSLLNAIIKMFFNSLYRTLNSYYYRDS